MSNNEKSGRDSRPPERDLEPGLKAENMTIKNEMEDLQLEGGNNNKFNPKEGGRTSGSETTVQSNQANRRSESGEGFYDLHQVSSLLSLRAAEATGRKMVLTAIVLALFFSMNFAVDWIQTIGVGFLMVVTGFTIVQAENMGMVMFMCSFSIFYIVILLNLLGALSSYLTKLVPYEDFSPQVSAIQSCFYLLFATYVSACGPELFRNLLWGIGGVYLLFPKSVPLEIFWRIPIGVLIAVLISVVLVIIPFTPPPFKCNIRPREAYQSAVEIEWVMTKLLLQTTTILLGYESSNYDLHRCTYLLDNCHDALDKLSENVAVLHFEFWRSDIRLVTKMQPILVDITNILQQILFLKLKSRSAKIQEPRPQDYERILLTLNKLSNQLNEASETKRDIHIDTVKKSSSESPSATISDFIYAFLCERLFTKVALIDKTLNDIDNTDPPHGLKRFGFMFIHLIVPKRNYKERARGSFLKESILILRPVVALAFACVWEFVPFLYLGLSEDPILFQLISIIPMTVGLVWVDNQGLFLTKLFDRSAGSLLGVFVVYFYVQYIPGYPWSIVPWFAILSCLIVAVGSMRSKHGYITTAGIASLVATWAHAFPGDDKDPDGAVSRDIALRVCAARLFQTLIAITISAVVGLFFFPQPDVREFYCLCGENLKDVIMMLSNWSEPTNALPPRITKMYRVGELAKAELNLSSAYSFPKHLPEAVLHAFQLMNIAYSYVSSCVCEGHKDIEDLNLGICNVLQDVVDACSAIGSGYFAKPRVQKLSQDNHDRLLKLTIKFQQEYNFESMEGDDKNVHIGTLLMALTSIRLFEAFQVTEVGSSKKSK